MKYGSNQIVSDASLFLVFIFPVILFGCNALRKDIVIKDWNAWTNDSIRNGIYIAVDSNSSRCCFKYQYKNGLRHGWQYDYRSDGSVFTKSKMKNGYYVSPYYECHSNGQVAFVYNISRKSLSGELHGTYKEYYENGNTKTNGYYRMVKGYQLKHCDQYPTDLSQLKFLKERKSVKVGEWKEYFENGQLKSEVKYANYYFRCDSTRGDQVINIAVDDTTISFGKFSIIISTDIQEVKNGDSITYDSAGVLIEDQKWKNGIRIK